MQRRTPAQLNSMRHRLAQALLKEPPSLASRARERILERRFFDLAGTAAPARVAPLLALRPQPRS